MKNYPPTIVLLLAASFVLEHAEGFSNRPLPQSRCDTAMEAVMMPNNNEDDGFQASSSSISSSRREWFSTAASMAALFTTATATPAVAAAEDNTQKFFAPGGTLVDYKVGVTVGNDRASKSRRNDNSNVIFGQDYYYKFGTAPQFIPIGDTSFPVKMPFVFAQQRYDNLKKYRERVQRGIDLIASLQPQIAAGNYKSIPEAESPEYSIRPFGLLANGFLASENTGTTNELFLARWYINEIYLDLGDVRTAKSQEDATRAYSNCLLAMNSYLGMLNRSITSKVGDPFDYLGTTPKQQQPVEQPTGDAPTAPPASEGDQTTTASPLPEVS